ncbi:hypothetical protein GCM10023231_20940 [Olivibacter ginsenosidimutans]|uniref:Exonuclease domain-containing protein n=1 Tax=Olivibacter ginsenosidimutans TaxID=1176537 RepID=A0ABP9B9Q5_9SPHI
MQEYLLFVDTETTGLPRKWTADYGVRDNWPSAVQVAWVLYTRDGREIKRENFYVSDNDVPITSRAQEIHGLEPVYLARHGVPRQLVMQRLAEDLNQYQPLVIGHFVLLDFHVLNADFMRCTIASPLEKARLYCTMLASVRHIKKPWRKYLRLNELYQELFGKPLGAMHHALVDAEATAACFFELWKRGEIDETAVAAQQHRLRQGRECNATGITRPWQWLLIFVVVLMLIGFVFLRNSA